jgi:hypothetical protein
VSYKAIGDARHTVQLADNTTESGRKISRSDLGYHEESTAAYWND